MTQDSKLHEAYVLHVRPYREADALVDVFFREQGRVGMVFRRVRGGKSTRAALLQPFQPVWMTCAGRHELRNGGVIEPRGAVVWLTGERLFSGLYLNELLMRLLQRDDPHPDLFDVYADTLRRLACEPVECVLRRFERRLLAAIGYELMFDVTADGEGIDPAGRYRYVPEQGFEPTLPQMPNSYAGASLLAIGAEIYDHDDTRRVAKRLFRELLAPHLGDKPLVSRSLFAAKTSPSST